MEEGKKAGGKLIKKPGGTLASRPDLVQTLRRHFPFEPTPSQATLFEKIQTWLEGNAKENPVFILKGYAGTGKTAFLVALIKVLSRLNLSAQLMAPTGRASKIMSSYTRRKAFTIHKRIFRYELDGKGNPVLRRQKNNLSNAVFIVDEASMVGNQREFGIKGILEELVTFVFEGKNNRLLFIGDTAQLPPVGTAISPALHAHEVNSRFGLEVQQHEMDDVVRQEKDSGILLNATALREIIRGHSQTFAFQTQGFDDIFRVKRQRVQEGLEYAYDKFGMENTLVVTRTNKQALHYNRMIRHHILHREEELEAGDWLMVVKNNYAVLDSDSDLGFIANGDLATVNHVLRYRHVGPLRLVELEIQLADDEEEACISCFGTADLLYSELPQMGEEPLREFQNAVMEEMAEETLSLKQRWELLRTNILANPIQIKFGYALTCHKAQGGQWDVVFVDHGWLKEGPLDNEFYRWLYTALTRARKQVFLIEPDGRLV